MSLEVRKRKKFSISEKLQIIAELESGTTQANLARSRNVAKTTIQTIWSDREKVKQNSSALNLDFKRARKCDFVEVDKEVFHWFNVQRGRHIPISGPILKGAAEDIAKKLGAGNFRASDGWLDRWKKRHGVVFKTASGESSAVDTGSLESWIRDVWPTLSRGYQANDIYNVDETGLFFRLLPNKTLDFKGSECHGGKQHRERLTVLLCTNATGTDKLTPLVIGSSAKPRCFKNIRDLKSLPVNYESNKRAWMTTQIFEKWLKGVELQMKIANRKILLLMDNCSPHVAASPKLENVKVVFLPPNTTSIGQPLDRGIINSFKVNYRKNLVRKLIARMDNRQDHKIDVLEAITGIKKAWETVTTDCIRNCFVNARIVPPDDDFILDETPINFETEMDALNASHIHFSDYVTVDSSIVLCDEEYTGCAAVAEELVGEGSLDEDEDPEREKVTGSQALQMLEQVKFFVTCEGGDGALLSSINNIEEFVMGQIFSSRKQSKITDFFQAGGRLPAEDESQDMQVIIDEDEINKIFNEESQTSLDELQRAAYDDALQVGCSRQASSNGALEPSSWTNEEESGDLGNLVVNETSCDNSIFDTHCLRTGIESDSKDENLNNTQDSTVESQEILSVMDFNADDLGAAPRNHWNDQMQRTFEQLTAIGTSNKNDRLRQLILQENGDLGSVLGKVKH